MFGPGGIVFAKGLFMKKSFVLHKNIKLRAIKKRKNLSPDSRCELQTAEFIIYMIATSKRTKLHRYILPCSTDS